MFIEYGIIPMIKNISSPSKELLTLHQEIVALREENQDLALSLEIVMEHSDMMHKQLLETKATLESSLIDLTMCINILTDHSDLLEADLFLENLSLKSKLDTYLHTQQEKSRLLTKVFSEMHEKWTELSCCLHADQTARDSDSPKSASILSAQQEKILGYIASGKSNKQIAYLLEISEGTVKQHLHAIFKMLGVTSRVSAIQKARELEIL